MSKDVTRQGLWINTSKKNPDNVYLSGVDKETGIKYWVFSEDGVSRLCTSILGTEGAPNGELVTVGNFEKKVFTKEGEEPTDFLTLDVDGKSFAVWPNQFYEEETRKPEYNLVMGG